MSLFDGGLSAGVYHNLPESAYRADPALSTSDLKLIGNPYRFHQKLSGNLPGRDSDSMALGRLFHTRILEPGKWESDIVVCPDEFRDRRKKANREYWDSRAGEGKTVITEEVFEQVLAMEERARAEGLSTPRQTEVSLMGGGKAWLGLPVKCRVDILGDREIIDIKTTRGYGAGPSEFARTARALKYHWQQWHYTHIARSLGIRIDRWRWFVIETEKPYCVAWYEFDGHTMEIASLEVQAAIKTVKECRVSNTWPDYTTTQPKTLSLFGTPAKI